MVQPAGPQEEVLQEAREAHVQGGGARREGRAARREARGQTEVGVPPPGQTAQGHPARVQGGLCADGDGEEAAVLRAVQPRPEGQDEEDRLPAPGGQSVEAGPGHGDFIQRDSPRKY